MATFVPPSDFVAPCDLLDSYEATLTASKKVRQPKIESYGGPIKPPAGTYYLWCKDNRARILKRCKKEAAEAGEKFVITSLGNIMKTEFNNNSTEEEKRRYAQISENLLADYNQKYEAWKLTDQAKKYEEILVKHIERMQKKETTEDGSNRRPIKPVTGYFLFFKEHKTQIVEDLKEECRVNNIKFKYTNVTKLCSEMWRNLPAEKKEPYKEHSKQLYADYKEKVKEFKEADPMQEELRKEKKRSYYYRKKYPQMQESYNNFEAESRVYKNKKRGRPRKFDPPKGSHVEQPVILGAYPITGQNISPMGKPFYAHTDSTFSPSTNQTISDNTSAGSTPVVTPVLSNDHPQFFMQRKLSLDSNNEPIVQGIRRASDFSNILGAEDEDTLVVQGERRNSSLVPQARRGRPRKYSLPNFHPARRSKRKNDLSPNMENTNMIPQHNPSLHQSISPYQYNPYFMMGMHPNFPQIKIQNGSESYPVHYNMMGMHPVFSSQNGQQHGSQYASAFPFPYNPSLMSPQSTHAGLYPVKQELHESERIHSPRSSKQMSSGAMGVKQERTPSPAKKSPRGRKTSLPTSSQDNPSTIPSPRTSSSSKKRGRPRKYSRVEVNDGIRNYIQYVPSGQSTQNIGDQMTVQSSQEPQTNKSPVHQNHHVQSSLEPPTKKNKISRTFIAIVTKCMDK